MAKQVVVLDATHTQLLALRKQTGLSMAEIVRQALACWLAQRSPARKPVAGIDFDPDKPMCQDDYEHFTGTGRYATSTLTEEDFQRNARNADMIDEWEAENV
jgi:hypothetical protein